MYFYKTYGLVIASELVLPELVEVSSTDTPDITIILRSVPENLARATYCERLFQVAGNICHVIAEGAARYRIEDGRRILVDAEPGAAPGDVRLYLLGSALGALLHQRHCLPLHVSSVITPSGVWAFTGDSGAGKSTLAATLHYKFGWPLLSDDVGAILPEKSDQLLFHSGPPRLKLWQDALAHLDISQDGLLPDLVRTNKFHLKLDTGFEQRPQPLRALVWLERVKPDEAASIAPVEGIQMLQYVLGAIYRDNFARQLNDMQYLFHQCGDLARQVRIYRYHRPWTLERFDTSLTPLINEIQSLGRVDTEAKLSYLSC